MNQPHYLHSRAEEEREANKLLFSWHRAGYMSLSSIPVLAGIVLVPLMTDALNRDTWFLLSLFSGLITQSVAASIIRVTWNTPDRLIYVLPLILFSGLGLLSGWISLTDVRLYYISPVLLAILGGTAYLVFAYGPGFFIPRLAYSFIGVPRAMLVMGTTTILSTGLYMFISRNGL